MKLVTRCWAIATEAASAVAISSMVIVTVLSPSHSWAQQPPSDLRSPDGAEAGVPVDYDGFVLDSWLRRVQRIESALPRARHREYNRGEEAPGREALEADQVCRKGASLTEFSAYPQSGPLSRDGLFVVRKPHSQALSRQQWSASVVQTQPAAAERGWVKRHPVATGALVGLGVGFVAGAATSEADLSKPFVGLIWGGVGASIGAVAVKAVQER